jgi:bud emergence protein 1
MKHTFTAERPDELSARYGEPVIIMAHSAEEWFVAKPIGRLGGRKYTTANCELDLLWRSVF